MKFLSLLVLAMCSLAINCQWISHNATYIVNTTVVHQPVYMGQHPPIFPGRNLTYYQPTANFNPGGHHLFVGTPRPTDILLFQRVYFLSGRLFLVREKIVEYPEPGSPHKYRTITAIRVYDKKARGDGGFASIRHGGIGHRNVTIRLVTKRGLGMNFLVEIYGQ